MADTYHPQFVPSITLGPNWSGSSVEAQEQLLVVVSESSGFIPATINIVVAYEHQNPGGDGSWPDNHKPQYRVPEIVTRPLVLIDGDVEATFAVTVPDADGVVANPVAGSATVTLAVTQVNADGVVANPVVNTGSATYGVTTTTGEGTVVNTVQPAANPGVYYRHRPKPRVKQPEFKLPIPEAPTYRIYGTARTTFDGPLRVEGQGKVVRPQFGAKAVVSLASTETLGAARNKRRFIGAANVSITVADAYADGIYDRSLRDQIEEEDLWLSNIVNVLRAA